MVCDDGKKLNKKKPVVDAHGEKPVTHIANLARLPSALVPLTEEKRWVNWSWELRVTEDGERRWTKPPRQPRDPKQFAKSNDPKTWDSYEHALQRCKDGEADGIGFMLKGSGIGAIDLDHCCQRDADSKTTEIDGWADELRELADGAYCEVTVSGTGLRLIGKTSLAEVHRKFIIDKECDAHIELFRDTNRFITVSGIKLKGSRKLLPSLDELIDVLLVRHDKPKPSPSSAQRGEGARSGHEWNDLIRNGVPKGDRSEVFQAVVWHLAAQKWTQEQIVAELERHPNGIGVKYADRLAEEVQRSYRKWEQANADNQRIDDLAQLDALEYDRIRKDTAEDMGVLRSTLDEKVRQRRAERRRAADAPPPPPDFTTLTKLAAPLIECKNVLDRFVEDFSKVITGEESTGKLLYLVATSRLFDKAMHAAVKGPSSGGKSEIRTRVLEFFPPEDIIAFTAMSERALLYMPGDFVHKILSMGEAITGEEVKFQDTLLRQLMSENKLIYHVAQKIDGEIKAITIEKNGPVSFLVTTTRNKLNPENETRMLSLEVDDSEAQTKAVLRKIASIEGYNRAQEIEFKVWHDFQRWLSAGDVKVKIPFALTLARNVPPKAVRLRRDFRQLLLAIKAHALLHREHRRRDDDGNIIATIDDDYAVVRELMADLLATTAEVKLRETMIETIAAVQELQPVGQLKEGATVQKVLRHLKLDRSSAYRRLQAAVDAEFLVNVQERKGQPGLYRVSEHVQPEEIQMLPDTKGLDEAVRARKRKARARS